MTKFADFFGFSEILKYCSLQQVESNPLKISQGNLFNPNDMLMWFFMSVGL